ncbi:MAG: SDR family oxidoreductase [Myxococcales bacterium]|nr:SDR family oxidoreductase [Myxococcales bacterium]
MGRLDDKVAMVTGGSGGIGSATLKRFVAEGAKVVCADIDEERGEKVAGELGDDAVFVRCDVSSLDDVTAAVDAAVQHFGSIDVLFNNAAWSSGGYVADLDPEAWDRSLRIMLTGPMYGMKAAIPYMLEQGGGSIVNTSSVYGLVASPGVAPYCSAKAGLINLTKTTAVEYGRRNIRVNAICPGVVETPMFEAVLGTGLTTREKVAEMHALGRTIQPEEIANLVLFLASNESSAITGQAVVIDGGLLSDCNLTGLPPVA